MALIPSHPVVAAIDVGTNAVRLEIASLLANGTRKSLYQERDAIRPGEPAGEMSLILSRANVLGNAVLGEGASCWMVTTRFTESASPLACFGEVPDDDDIDSWVWRFEAPPSNDCQG